MHTWDVYLEEADSDEPRVKLGQIMASTGADALEKASARWGFETYDLVVKQVIQKESR